MGREADPSAKRARWWRRRRHVHHVNVVVALIVLILLCGLVLAGSDYYALLGVPKDADAATIKRAYRKKSLQYHPDKNPDDDAAKDKFVQLGQAYEVLSDPEKRSVYDRFGEEGLKQNAGGGGGGGRGGFDPFDSFFDGFGGFDFEFGGRRRGGARGGGSEARKGPSLVVPLFLSLESVYSGDVIEAAHKKQVVCSAWSDCVKKCTTCGGTGWVMSQRQMGFAVMQTRSPCPKCGGKGKISTGNCEKCPKGQFEEVEKVLLIDVEQGAPEMSEVRFEGEADEHDDMNPGDIIFRVQTEPHERFVRMGNDLFHRMNISLREALVGVNRVVKQLDGRSVPIQKSSITLPLQQVRVVGEGLPHFRSDTDKGDMIVEFWVEFPDHLSADQIKQVHALFPEAQAFVGEPPKEEL
ncbi:DnaJ-like shv [Porphyridium purpureum]|uniref:DnaJ-like shv n=1 Tax=Porphyridium purpureum TaxID=35688 RepID=A0A5J4Z3Y3_PORPP|nr:DnaJ-like shv [Porphyridium purpureum]|eukprot:POR1802..scf295_1